MSERRRNPKKRKGIPSLIKSMDLTLSGDLLYSNAKFSWKRLFFSNRYPRPGARTRTESQCERDKRGTTTRGSLIVARFNDVEHYGALFSLFLSYDKPRELHDDVTAGYYRRHLLLSERNTGNCHCRGRLR